VTRDSPTSLAHLNTRYLCTGCGTCAGVCPTNAISMETVGWEVRIRVSDDCTECGRCVDVCPGLSFASPRCGNTAPDEVTGSSALETLIGQYHSAYVGFATDEKLRAAGTSGGITSAVLTHLMATGHVDRAIVCRLDPSSLQATPYVAADAEGVLKAAGSKYCPAPVNVQLQEVLANQHLRYAVVGLPCHIAGVSKAMARIPALENIVLRLGLFCSHGLTGDVLPFLLSKYGPTSQGVQSCAFRAGGWPGALVVKYDDGERVSLPHREYWGTMLGSYFFTPYRCLTCTDLTAEQADLSLGDAWLPEIESRDQVGTSLALSRSEKAEDILQEMAAQGSLALAEISPREAVRAQRAILSRKKLGTAARASLLRALGKPTPTATYLGGNRKAFIGAAATYINAWFSHTRAGRWLLRRAPASYLRRYQSWVYRMASGGDVRTLLDDCRHDERLSRGQTESMSRKHS